MEGLLEVGTAILSNYKEIVEQFFVILGGVSVALGALYTIALKIPGDQPDKIIKSAYLFTTNASKKKED